LEQILDELRSAIYSDNTPRALSLVRWLLNSVPSLSMKTCTVLVEAFAMAIPGYPVPVVGRVLLDQHALLEEVIARIERIDAPALLGSAETLNYRLLESHGRYAAARGCISRMLERNPEPFERAQLINNYGYEYLLEGSHALALPFFKDALKRFEHLGDEIQVANTNANLLTCESSLGGHRDQPGLLPRLLATHATLHQNRDWRIRKTMLLLAARAESQERLAVAVAWARRALAASADIKTGLRQSDRQYLKKLQRKRKRRMHRPVA
jgi:tetratricopeptide (TPR) repeat protein